MTVTLERIARADARRSAHAAATDAAARRLETSGARRENLLSLVLGQAAPDSVRFVHLQGVTSAFQQRRASGANRLGLGLAACSGRPAFAFRVEEIRARHSSAGGMQLPVPQVGVRPRKTPGIGHRSSPLDLCGAGRTGRRGTRSTRCRGVVRQYRRLDDPGPAGRAGIADDSTIECAAIMIKTARSVVSATPSRPRRRRNGGRPR